VRDLNEIIKEKKKYFERHELTVICNHDKVKRFQFRQPDTGCYGFNLTTADNLIVMNGDCYTLILEPGYGRDGFWFLLGSISRDWGYLLGKCPFRSKDILTEYSYDQAMENLKYYVENEYITREQADYCYGLDDGEFYGEPAYYKFCLDHDIDEPMSPRALTDTTLLQIAGLQAFADKYEEMFPEKTTNGLELS
jgi:hypothetical protein